MRTVKPPATRLVKRAFQLTTALAREHRALRRAMRTMPRPVPWDWAAPRLVPILSGPSFDPPGEALVRARSSIGPMVQFGVDVGGAFMYVDEPVAQRWECSPEQLMERLLENDFERRALHPLWLGVFALSDGWIESCDEARGDEEDADWTS